MLAVLRQRNFGLLFAGGLISSLGDFFLFVALPFYVYNLTGSALATGGTFIAETLPSILFGSLAGVFVDRWDRRRTMIVADVLRAILLLGLLTVVSRDTVWVVFAITFVQSTIGQFFNPARGALVPVVVTEEDLLAANSLSSVGNQLTMLVGPLLGGACLALFGFGSVIAVDSASFVLSAIAIGFVAVAAKTGASPDPVGPVPSSALAKVWIEYRQGLSLMRRNPLVSALLLAMGLASVGQGLINVQMIPWVKDVIHGDSAVLGWIISAQGVGGLIGGLALSSVGNSFSPTRVLSIGLLVSGVLIVAIVNTTILPAILLLIALVGVASVVFVVRLQTMLQEAVPDEFRGRVLGAYGTTQAALLLVGMASSGVLGGIVGPVQTLDLAGLLYASGGVATAIVLPRTLRPPDAARIAAEVRPD